MAQDDVTPEPVSLYPFQWNAVLRGLRQSRRTALAQLIDDELNAGRVSRDTAQAMSPVSERMGHDPLP